MLGVPSSRPIQSSIPSGAFPEFGGDIFAGHGKLTGNKHFKVVFYGKDAPQKSNKGADIWAAGGNVDISDCQLVISEKTSQDGQVVKTAVYKAPIYYFKPAASSFMISLMCLVLPVMIGFTILPQLPPIPQWATISLIAVSCLGYLGLSWAYNIIRVPFVVAYLVLRAVFYDSWKKGVIKSIEENGVEIFKQIAFSIANIIRAPFYALLYNLGHIYALFSPLNGRKFVTLLELGWNHGVPLRESYSLAGCFGSGFKLGMYNAGSLTMCYHLRGYAVFSAKPEFGAQREDGAFESDMKEEQLQAILIHITSPSGREIFDKCIIQEERRLLSQLPSGCVC